MSDEVVDQIKKNQAAAGRRWYPGMNSPNPGGRPKAVARLQDLAREHTPAALAKIVALMDDPKSSRMMQLAAARELLDRAYGKPMQSTEISAVVSADDEVLAEMDCPGYLFETARRLAFLLTAGAKAGDELPTLPVQSDSEPTGDAP